MLRLNLGAGRDHRPGYLNVDRIPSETTDIVHDLNKFPYPWGDDSVESILLRHVLEHVDDIRAIMDELWRILVPAGLLEIYVPHFSHFQAFTHPEHRHAFHYNSLNMITPNAAEPYTDHLWNIKEVELHFTPPLLGHFFNRHKFIYTSTILAYLFPAYEIKYLLTSIKPKR